MNFRDVPNPLAVAVLLLTSFSADAIPWQATVQNGDPGTLGFGANQFVDGSAANSPTRGLVGWFSIDVNGGHNHAIYAQGLGPDYACYGLTVNGDTTCADAGTPVIWSPTPAVFSGFFNENGNFLDLSWTGQVGTAVPFAFTSLFTSSILSGSYDTNGNISGGVDAGAGYDADGFSCWNNPATGIPGPPDFCGNATGVSTTAPTMGGQTKNNRQLPLGVIGYFEDPFFNQLDWTVTIDMGSSTYSDCVADAGCTPGTNSADIFAQWRVNLACATTDGKCCDSVDTGPCPPDTDGDSVSNTQDNCTLVANGPNHTGTAGPLQNDTDGDGYGNMCDGDLNQDNFINVVDLGLFKQQFFTADPDADLNGDGIVNVVDLGLMKQMFFKAPGPSGVAP